MPLTRAHVGVERLPDDIDHIDAINAFINELHSACWELVPAGMHSELGPLTPGSIQFVPNVTQRAGLTVDVFLEIESFDLPDRQNTDDRTKEIKAALTELFPGKTFAVWVKLVKSGYATDGSDPESDEDMSMEVALQRALARLEPETARNPPKPLPLMMR
jgi:hypothetical protein